MILNPEDLVATRPAGGEDPVAPDCTAHISDERKTEFLCANEPVSLIGDNDDHLARGIRVPLPGTGMSL